MASFNKVILMGNLTRDPELRYTPKGTAIARLGVAVNRRWTSEGGEQREETTFVDVDAFGKQAETLGQYMKKGRPIFIEGRLRLDSWEDKNTGQKRSKLYVVANRVESRRETRQDAPERPQDREPLRRAPEPAQDARPPQRMAEAPAGHVVQDGQGATDDIPF